MNSLKQSTKNYKRIVIKIGSSLLCGPDGSLDTLRVGEVSAQIAALLKEGRQIIIVSSGAIALGMSVLHLESRPKELAYLQAAAAIGQHELMNVYRECFKAKNLTCAQILLTWEDFDDRTRFLNAKQTLLALLKLGVVPVINENDTVSTDEIKFGDNDKLSALVSILTGAHLLLILSDVDGLLDRRKNVVRLVEKITPEVRSLACPTKKKACVGGMVTKIDAARIAVDSGIPCVIANGRRSGSILSVASDPYGTGTLFAPTGIYLQDRKRWIAFGVKPKGVITVDPGAKNALVDKKSLLAVGIKSVGGHFSSGDIVSLQDETGNEFARGKIKLSSSDLEKVKGGKAHREIIHRNDIVILG